MKKIRILIDGDEICYKASVPSSVWQHGMDLYATRPMDIPRDELEILYVEPDMRAVSGQIKSMIRAIETTVKDYLKTDDVETVCVISGKGNYRKDAYASYKENRATARKPFYLDYARTYLCGNYNTKFAMNQEADDLLGILQDENSVLCSSDKDMLTIPGIVYNIMRDTFVHITEEDAHRNYFYQVMCGDRADNVQGLKGVGPVKARKILDSIEHSKDLYTTVRKEYEKRNQSVEDLHKSMFLQWIQQSDTDPKDPDRFIKWIDLKLNNTKETINAI